jgi:hypothetical protein
VQKHHGNQLILEERMVFVPAPYKDESPNKQAYGMETNFFHVYHYLQPN